MNIEEVLAKSAEKVFGGGFGYRRWGYGGGIGIGGILLIVLIVYLLFGCG